MQGRDITIEVHPHYATHDEQMSNAIARLLDAPRALVAELITNDRRPEDRQECWCSSHTGSANERFCRYLRDQPFDSKGR